MATKKQFLREYIKAIRDGNAAVFAGAGLSRPLGFVVWKELLRPLAEDIGLNIDDERDLTNVAQYVRNKSGNRAAINSSILEAYSKDVEINENVTILTRLPIYTYWTTNYDHLIEEGLQAANRNSDVRACLISSDEDGNEGESKNLSRNNEFTLTIFPKPAEFVQPAEKALYHPTTRQHNKSV
jgi:hypothetical protein